MEIRNPFKINHFRTLFHSKEGEGAISSFLLSAFCFLPFLFNSFRMRSSTISLANSFRMRSYENGLQ